MPADVREIVARLSGYQGPAWTAGEIYLIQSVPGSKPHYERLHTCPVGTGGFMTG
jgi:hypothetical protein